MVFKETLQKESLKQSLPKVSSEAAVRRGSSKLVFPNIHRKTSALESLFNKVAGQNEDLVIVNVIYTLLVEIIGTRFHRLTSRNQKLVQSKPLQQRLYALILGLCRQVFVQCLMSVNDMQINTWLYLSSSL